MPYLCPYIGLRTFGGTGGGDIRPGERQRGPDRRKSAEESDEGAEQLLHLLLGQRGIGVAAQALPHLARHDLEPGPVKRPAHRGKLRDHLGAVPPVLDHRDDPGQLAMGAAKPVQHGATGAVIDLHQSALPSASHNTLRGISGACHGRGHRTREGYSHSIVPGGLLVTSSTTRLISLTSLVIRVATRASTGSGSRAQSAVMASSLVTGRSTTGWP